MTRDPRNRTSTSDVPSLEGQSLHSSSVSHSTSIPELAAASNAIRRLNTLSAVIGEKMRNASSAVEADLIALDPHSIPITDLIALVPNISKILDDRFETLKKQKYEFNCQLEQHLSNIQGGATSSEDEAQIIAQQFAACRSETKSFRQAVTKFDEIHKRITAYDDELKNKALTDAGLSSFEEGWDKLSSIADKRRELSGIMGIGRLYNQKELAILKEESNALQQILNLQREDSIRYDSRYCHYLIDDLKRIHEDVAGKISYASKQLIIIANRSIVEAPTPKLPPEIYRTIAVDTVNTDFPRMLLKDLEESNPRSGILDRPLKTSPRESLDSKDPDLLRNPEVLRAKELSIGYLLMPLANYGSKGSPEHERTEQAIRDCARLLFPLNAIASHFRLLSQRDFKETYEHIYRYISDRQITKAAIALNEDVAELHKTLKTITNSTFTEPTVEDPSRWINGPDSLIQKARSDIVDFFINNSAVIEHFGEKRLLDARAAFGDLALHAVLKGDGHSDNSVSNGEKLFHFAHFEHAPFILLNAFREAGYSGTYPFLSAAADREKPTLARYALSLSDLDLEQIAALSVPGLTETIKLVRANPTTFNHLGWEMEDGQAEFERTYRAVRHNVQKVCCHILRTGALNEQLFAIDTLCKLHTPLDSETTSELVRCISEHQSQEVRECASALTITLQKSVGAPVELIDATLTHLNSKFPSGSSEATQHAAVFLDTLRDTTLNTHQITKLSHMTGRSQDEISRLHNLISTLTSEQPHPRIFNSSTHGFEVDKFSRFMDAANFPFALEALRELIRQGAQIDDYNLPYCDGLANNGANLLEAVRKHGASIVSLEKRFVNEEQKYLPGLNPKLHSLRLLSLGKETWDSYQKASYPASFYYRVVSGMIKHAPDSSIHQKFTQNVPKTHPLFTDRVAYEFFLTHIDHAPAQTLPLFTQVVDSLGKLSGKESLELVSLLGLVGALKEEELGKAASVWLKATPGATFDDLRDHLRGLAVLALSKKYPPEELRSLDTEKLSRFIEVYTAYEETLRRFNEPESIPIMRTIAVVELLGGEREFHANDPAFLAKLRQGAGRYFKDETERAACLEYITRRESSTELELAFPTSHFSDSRRKQFLSGWHAPDLHDHLGGAISAEDRLISVRNVLSDLFYKHHFSDALVTIENLTADSKVLKTLSDEFKALTAVERELKDPGAIAQITLGDSQLSIARRVLTEIHDLPPDEVSYVLSSRKQKVVDRQRALKEWEPVRRLGKRYEEQIGALLRDFGEKREALGHQSTAFQKLGFDYEGSFREKVFSGDLKLLEGAMREELALPEASRKLDRDEGVRLEAAVADLQHASSLAEDYLLNLLPVFTKTLENLRTKAKIVDKLILATADKSDTERVLATILEADVRLHGYILEQISSLPSESEKFIKATHILDQYRDQSAIADLEGAIGAIGDKGNAASPFTYMHEAVFSKALMAMKGQCLDYRSTHNSVGNSIYNMALMDPSRQVLVAYDESGAARFNAITYLASVGVGPSYEYAFPAIVLDIPYVPDGSAMSWSKLEGALAFLTEKSRNMGIPLVLPKTTFQDYQEQIQNYFFNAGAETAVAPAKVRIVPGATGAVYVELDGFKHYEQDSWVSSNCMGIRPF